MIVHCSIIGGGKEPNWDGVWIVFGAHPGEVIDLNDKCKAIEEVVIRFVGKWWEATNFVLAGQIAYVQLRTLTVQCGNGTQTAFLQRESGVECLPRRTNHEGVSDHTGI